MTSFVAQAAVPDGFGPFLSEVVEWFTTAENWTGQGGIVQRVVEHIQLSAVPLVVAAVLTIPTAAWLAHRGRGGTIAISIVNIGRAVPSFGVVALSLPFTIWLARVVPFIDSGLGTWPTWIALFALALPPMFTNTYTGVRDVDPDVVEAAVGMGMTDREVLTRVRLPLATPLVVAGVRVTAVQVVATATLGAFVAAGGLGRYIWDGFQQRDFVEMFAGALLVALLSIATEGLFSAVERWGLPAGVRRLRHGAVLGERAI